VIVSRVKLKEEQHLKVDSSRFHSARIALDFMGLNSRRKAKKEGEERRGGERRGEVSGLKYFQSEEASRASSTNLHSTRINALPSA
jgi:hypothetical protein